MMLNILKRLFCENSVRWNIEDLSKFSDVSDVILCVTYTTGKQIATVNYKVHRVVLAASGKPFEILLENNTTNNKISIEETNSHLFEICLKFIYNWLSYYDIQDLKSIELEELKSMAQKYEILDLHKICCYFITSCVNEDNVFECLYISFKTKNEKLKQKCYKFISEKTQFVFQHEKLKFLDCECLRGILSLPTLRISELEVFLTVLKFAEETVRTKLYMCEPKFTNYLEKEMYSECIEITAVHETTKDENRGKRIYLAETESAFELQRSRIRTILVNNKLINQVRILTLDLRDFIFHVLKTPVFHDSEKIEIWNYLLTGKKSESLLSNPCICNITIPRAHSPKGQITKRRAHIHANISFIETHFINSFTNFSVVEEFEYISEIPMFFRSVTFSMNSLSADIYKHKIRLSYYNIVDELYITETSKDSMNKITCEFSMSKRFLLKKGCIFNIFIRNVSCIKLNFKRIQDIDYNLLVRPTKSNISCIDKFIVTLVV